MGHWPVPHHAPHIGSRSQQTRCNTRDVCSMIGVLVDVANDLFLILDLIGNPIDFFRQLQIDLESAARL